MALPAISARRASAQSIWPRMAAQGVDARIERRVRALGGLGRERAGDERRCEAGCRPRTARPARRRVENCVPLSSARPSFGPSVSGARPACAQRLGGRHAARGRIHLADADHGGRHVRERRQIARGADRALAGHHRQSGPWSSIASSMAMVAGRTPEAPCGQAGELQRHHQPHDRRAAPARRRRRHARARCWCCSRARSAGLDAHAGELAEAGVDAVDRLAAGDDGLDRPRALPRSPVRQAGSRRTAAPR